MFRHPLLLFIIIVLVVFFGGFDSRLEIYGVLVWRALCLHGVPLLMWRHLLVFHQLLVSLSYLVPLRGAKQDLGLMKSGSAIS